MPNFVSSDKGYFKLSDEPLEALAQKDFIKSASLDEILLSGIKRWNAIENKELE